MSKSALPTATCYTDGSARGNPGPGGYGTVLIAGTRRKELSGGFQCTTNNRMEILAAIAGLEALLRPCHIVIHSDSKYLVNTMTKGWIENWKRNGWAKRDRTAVKNTDLWKRLLVAKAEHSVEWKWVKGHAGNEENERCDELATTAADGDDLEPDEGFEAAQAAEKDQDLLSDL